MNHNTLQKDTSTLKWSATSPLSQLSVSCISVIHMILFHEYNCFSIPVNPCLSNPCQNGGQCYAANDYYSFTCVCASPYAGTTCTDSKFSFFSFFSNFLRKKVWLCLCSSSCEEYTLYQNSKFPSYTF